MNLTEAQKRLLTELGKGGMNVNEDYRPARRLVELGLAETTHSSFGSMNIYITEAGRTALKEQEQGR